VKSVVDTGSLQGFLRMAQYFSVNIIPFLPHTELPSRIISKKQILKISDIVIIVMLFWIWGSIGNSGTFTVFGLTMFKKKGSGANAVIVSYPDCLTSNIQFPFDR
jgi:hypothetical protein